MSDLHSNVSAQIDVKPARSHVVLVALIGLSTICFGVGFLFLWHNATFAWIPLLIGFLVLFLVCIGWILSRKDIDLEGGMPTHIGDSMGNYLRTDTRALTSPEVVQNIERIFSGLCYREPLPKPEGMVDDSGSPIPNSAQEAANMIDDINMESQRITDIVMSGLNIQTDMSSGVQPILDEPLSQELIDTNIKGKD